MSEEQIQEAGATGTVDAPTDGPTREAVLDVLKGVVDPELGINIVDLGLVYRVEIEDGVVVIDDEYARLVRHRSTAPGHREGA